MSEVCDKLQQCLLKSNFSKQEKEEYFINLEMIREGKNKQIMEVLENYVLPYAEKDPGVIKIFFDGMYKMMGVLIKKDKKAVENYMQKLQNAVIKSKEVK